MLKKYGKPHTLEILLQSDKKKSNERISKIPISSPLFLPSLPFKV